jgi:hypothetical protein
VLSWSWGAADSALPRFKTISGLVDQPTEAIGMRRREFIRLIGVAVLSWPRVAIGQQAGKVPTIGFLGTATQSGWSVEAFDKRLRELGWIDGQTITIEYRR